MACLCQEELREAIHRSMKEKSARNNFLHNQISAKGLGNSGYYLKREEPSSKRIEMSQKLLIVNHFFMKKIRISLLFVASLVGIFGTSCTWNGGEVPGPTSIVVWSGPTVTFEKGNESDPTLERNQDRITEDVWITRGNNGGQIFNAAVESNSNKATSPSGTQWAVGTTENLSELNFENFRTAIGKPKEAIGKDLVLLLVEENIAIDIKITKWSGSKQGGFAYERSSQ